MIVARSCSGGPALYGWLKYVGWPAAGPLVRPQLNVVMLAEQAMLRKLWAQARLRPTQSITDQCRLVATTFESSVSDSPVDPTLTEVSQESYQATMIKVGCPDHTQKAPCDGWWGAFCRASMMPPPSFPWRCEPHLVTCSANHAHTCSSSNHSRRRKKTARGPTLFELNHYTRVQWMIWWPGHTALQ